MRMLLLKLSLPVAALSLTACIGAGVVRQKTVTYDRFDLDRSGVLRETARPSSLSEAEVARRWGRPATSWTEADGTLVWRYPQGPGIGGAKPLGPKSTEIRFRDHRAVEVNVSEGSFRGAAYSL